MSNAESVLVNLRACERSANAYGTYVPQRVRSARRRSRVACSELPYPRRRRRKRSAGERVHGGRGGARAPPCPPCPGAHAEAGRRALPGRLQTHRRRRLRAGRARISLERFYALCAFYGVAPAQLLAEIEEALGGRPELTVDLTRLEGVGTRAVHRRFRSDAQPTGRSAAPTPSATESSRLRVAAGEVLQELAALRRRRPPGRRTTPPRSGNRPATSARTTSRCQGQQQDHHRVGDRVRASRSRVREGARPRRGARTRAIHDHGDRSPR